MNGYVSPKTHIAMNDECDLVAIAYKVDDLGISKQNAELKTPVFCGRLAVDGKEYYEAAQSNIRPECILVVHAEEYSGQDYVDFEGKRYTIYRRYERTDGLLELYCTLKVGG